MNYADARRRHNPKDSRRHPRLRPWSSGWYARTGRIGGYNPDIHRPDAPCAARS